MAESFSLTDVEAFEQRPAAWTAAATESAADQMVRDEMAAVRATYQRNGALVLDASAFERYEDTFREKLDRELLDNGIAIEKERAELLERIDAETKAAETLRPAFAGEFAPGTEKALLAELLDEQKRARYRADFAGLNYAQLADLYERAEDGAHNEVVRIVEDAVQLGTLAQLGIVNADSTDTAAAMTKLQDLVTVRRKARVPKWLTEAKERVVRTRTLTFTSRLDHLRQGRGVARRPLIQTKTGVAR